MWSQNTPLIEQFGGRGLWISRFEAFLVSIVNYLTARATQRHPVSKNKNKAVKEPDDKSSVSEIQKSIE